MILQYGILCSKNFITENIVKIDFFLSRFFSQTLTIHKIVAEERGQILLIFLPSSPPPSRTPPPPAPPTIPTPIPPPIQKKRQHKNPLGSHGRPPLVPPPFPLTNIQTFFPTSHVSWPPRIFNCTACIYQAATRWDLPPWLMMEF